MFSGNEKDSTQCTANPRERNRKTELYKIQTTVGITEINGVFFFFLMFQMINKKVLLLWSTAEQHFCFHKYRSLDLNAVFDYEKEQLWFIERKIPV